MSTNINLSNKLHPNAIKGILLFNQKKFFEAHEELEFAWRAEPGPIRDLYRGILQIGVAYYHLSHRNFSGAQKLIGRAMKWLKPYSGFYLGINISKLKKMRLSSQKKSPKVNLIMSIRLILKFLL